MSGDLTGLCLYISVFQPIFVLNLKNPFSMKNKSQNQEEFLFTHAKSLHCLRLNSSLQWSFSCFSCRFLSSGLDYQASCSEFKSDTKSLKRTFKHSQLLKSANPHVWQNFFIFCRVIVKPVDPFLGFIGFKLVNLLLEDILDRGQPVEAEPAVITCNHKQHYFRGLLQLWDNSNLGELGQQFVLMHRNQFFFVSNR